jgi:hypothetical protein
MLDVDDLYRLHAESIHYPVTPQTVGSQPLEIALELLATEGIPCKFSESRRKAIPRPWL